MTPTHPLLQPDRPPLHSREDTQAKTDAEHCSACARYFVELCYKFQVSITAESVAHDDMTYASNISGGTSLSGNQPPVNADVGTYMSILVLPVTSKDCFLWEMQQPARENKIK